MVGLLSPQNRRPRSLCHSTYGHQSVPAYLRAPQGRTALDGLKLPTLLAWGADEKLIAVANGEWIRDHVPGSELVMFAKSGHCPMLEESSQFNEVVTRFVGSLVAPKGPASGEA